MTRLWLRSLVIAVLLAMMFLPVASGPPTVAAAQCEFVLGFKALHDTIPNIVGNCLENEHFNPQNGDALQLTTGTRTDGGVGGLLVWRSLDNITAFTNGSQTWLLGPFGLETRPNTVLFPWEQEIQNAINLVRSKGYEVSNARNYNPAANLHVLVGFQVPTADAHNQNAFFFTTGGQFLGTDTADTSADIGVAAQSNDTVTLSYVLYNPQDPMCCPTAGTANVRYHFDGTKLTPLDPIPPSSFNAPGSRR
ncbi:MAG: LppP/LprE family lipoprotein [Chloroflexota bacterium]|nr:MAG: LppP/LprE family lipoprotein [Chloroflexota bacterium]